jgi:hypothetical protein
VNEKNEMVWNSEKDDYVELDSDRIDEKRKKGIMDNIIWHANQIKRNPSWNKATIRDIIGHFNNVIKTSK